MFTLESTTRRSVRTLAAAVALAAFAISAAADIRNLVVFGDSLSDTGNALARTQANRLVTDRPTHPFYSDGRWTNGRDNTGVPDPQNPGRTIPNPDLGLNSISRAMGVWHEQLARRLQVAPAGPSELRGSNFAYGGATSANGTFGDGTFRHLGSQLQQYNLAPRADTERTLFITWAGGNDIRDAALARGATRESILAASERAVANMTTFITALKQNTHPNQSVAILWPNLPPLGLTPEGRGMTREIQRAMNDASFRFRELQLRAVVGLEERFARGGGGLNLFTLDVYTLFLDLIDGRGEFKPADIRNGIVEARDFFGNPSFSAATFNPRRNPAVRGLVNPDTFVFWDQVHPTARTHQAIGNAAFTRVPTPGAVGLAILGLIAALRRRRPVAVAA